MTVCRRTAVDNYRGYCHVTGQIKIDCVETIDVRPDLVIDKTVDAAGTEIKTDINAVITDIIISLVPIHQRRLLQELLLDPILDTRSLGGIELVA